MVQYGAHSLVQISNTRAQVKMRSEVVMLVILCRIVGKGPLTEVQLQVLHKVPVQKTEQDILQDVG